MVDGSGLGGGKQLINSGKYEAVNQANMKLHIRFTLLDSFQVSQPYRLPGVDSVYMSVALF